MIDPVFAYIDPGSGSLIIQALIATLIAIPVFFRSQIAKVTGLSRRRAEKPAPADDRPDSD